ncbi:MAG: hypothetical protein DMF73_14485, partial [Acidobacteria bacterium]
MNSKALQLFGSLTAAVCLFLAAGALWLSIAGKSQGAISFGTLFIVNSTGDDHDASPGDGRCETQVGNGVCTLRAAIEEVVARNNGGDGININIPSTDPLCNSLYPGACVIAQVSAFQDLSVSVAITGQSNTNIVIDGLGYTNFGGHRVFN